MYSPFNISSSVAQSPTPAPTLTNRAACETVDQQAQQVVSNFTPKASSRCLSDDDCTYLVTAKNLPQSGLCVGVECQAISKAQAYDWLMFLQNDPQLNRVCQLRDALQCTPRLNGCRRLETACVNQECVALEE